VPMVALDTVALPTEWRFVVTPSGVPAQKAGTARDAYNRLSEGTRILLDLWNQHSDRITSSLGSALIAEGISLESVRSSPAVDRLRASVRQADVPRWSQAELETRLEHFIREDARIPEAVTAFAAADAVWLGQLAVDSQHDAETLLGNQIPETTELPRTARTLGAFAARSFGAGFGGSVWALVERGRAEEFARRWSSEAFVAAPGPPLLELGR